MTYLTGASERLQRNFLGDEACPFLVRKHLLATPMPTPTPSLQDSHCLHMTYLTGRRGRAYLATPPCKPHAAHARRISQGGLSV